MTKAQLITKLADAHPYLSRREVETIVETFFDRIAVALVGGDRVELRGFGTFSVRRRDARIGRNPHTGDSVDIAEMHAPFFRAGKPLLGRLNRADQHTPGPDDA